jgi:hypothetical protein
MLVGFRPAFRIGYDGRQSPPSGCSELLRVLVTEIRSAGGNAENGSLMPVGWHVQGQAAQ